jgi:outer membrane protein OmpA-like peptidoglycan-associated protein
MSSRAPQTDPSEGKHAEGRHWPRGAAWPGLRLAFVMTLLWTACATPPRSKDEFFFVRPAPERFSCLLVVPFTNLSNADQAGDLATRLFVTYLAADSRFHAFDAGEVLSALGVEGGAGAKNLGDENALVLAQVAGADGVLLGSVGGSWDPSAKDGALLIEGRLVSVASGDAVWGGTKIMARSERGPHEALSEVMETGIRTMVTRLRAEIVVGRTVAHQACLRSEWRQAISARASKNLPVAAEPPPALATAEEQAPPSAAATATPAPGPEATPDVALTAIPAPAPKVSSEPPAQSAQSSAAQPTTPLEATAASVAPLSPAAEELWRRLEAGDSVPIPGIIFAGQSPRIEKVDSPLINPLGEIMTARPSLVLELRVHTDPGSGPLEDKTLTQGQASSLGEHLATQWKIAPERFVPVGKGSDFPIQPNISRRGRLANRRVEVVLKGRS